MPLSIYKVSALIEEIKLLEFLKTCFEAAWTPLKKYQPTNLQPREQSLPSAANMHAPKMQGILVLAHSKGMSQRESKSLLLSFTAKVIANVC